MLYSEHMPKPRGRSHTTLTTTAASIVKLIETQSGVKMIAPGEISSARSSVQRLTITFTRAGLSLTISGEGIQRLAVHTTNELTAKNIATTLKQAKKLRGFIISERVRRPGI